MINIRKQGDRVTAYLTEFVIDEKQEIEELPIFPNVAKGSVCFCIENGVIYILGGNNEWVTMKTEDDKEPQLFGEVFLSLDGTYQDNIVGITENGDD